jgi:hypothetical protein
MQRIHGGFRCLHQCCGSETFCYESESGSDFSKVLDPEPYPTFKNYEISLFLDGLINVSDLDPDSKPRVTDPDLAKSSDFLQIRIHNTGLYFFLKNLL